jgi:quercetin dioxygenase-like cupin family protein
LSDAEKTETLAASIAEQRFIASAATPWERVGEGVRRQILGHGADLMMVTVEFEAGAIGPLHRHPHRQATYVVRGRFETTIDGEMQILEAGDSFYVPANLDHGVRALTAGTLIDVFTPTRQDFLGSA